MGLDGFPGDDVPAFELVPVNLPPLDVESLSLEQLLQLRARLSEVINNKLAAMGMKLKDTAKITFEPAADPFWDELKEALTSLGCQASKVKSIIATMKKERKRYSTLQDAIADAVALAQRTK